MKSTLGTLWFGGPLVLICAGCAEPPTLPPPPAPPAPVIHIVSPTPAIPAFGQSLITLHMTNAPTPVVYAELFRQAGSPIDPAQFDLPSNPPCLTINADHQPFWTVFLSLNQFTGVWLDRFGGVLRIIHNPPISPPQVAISGGIIVSATGINIAVYPSSHAVVGASNAPFTVGLEAMAEPSMLVLDNASSPWTVDEAIDDHSNSLLPAGPQTCYGGVRLKFAAHNPGTRIALLRGKVTLIVQTEGEKIEIPNLLHASHQQFPVGDTTVTYDGCATDNHDNGTQYVTSLSIPQDPQGRWKRWWHAGENVRVYDAAGREMFIGAYGQNPDGKRLNFLAYLNGSEAIPPGTGIPAKLVWYAPKAMREITVPFEFHNLDLSTLPPLVITPG